MFKMIYTIFDIRIFKVNTHGYVLPENSYQYRYSVSTNTHLNNSSPKPFMKSGGYKIDIFNLSFN